MTHELMKQVVENEIDTARNILLNKNESYSADTDALAAFKVAAALQNESPQKALFGMLAKHIGSIAKMCCSTNHIYSIDIWEEKITDTINYMLLLYCIVGEQYMDSRKVCD